MPLSALCVQSDCAKVGLTKAAAVLPVLEGNLRRMEVVLYGLLALALAGERE